MNIEAIKDYNGEGFCTVIYDIERENGDTFTLEAYYYKKMSENNKYKLILKQIDNCDLAEQFYGDRLRIAIYNFDVINTLKLMDLMGDMNLLKAIYEYFDGEMRDEEFKKMITENGIVYEKLVF